MNKGKRRFLVKILALSLIVNNSGIQNLIALAEANGNLQFSTKSDTVDYVATEATIEWLNLGKTELEITYDLVRDTTKPIFELEETVDNIIYLIKITK